MRKITGKIKELNDIKRFVICVYGGLLFGIRNQLIDTIMYMGALVLPILALIRSIRRSDYIHLNNLNPKDERINTIYRMFGVTGCVYMLNYLFDIKFQWLHVLYILGFLCIFFILYLLKREEEKFKVLNIACYVGVICIYSFSALLIINFKGGKVVENRTHTVVEKIYDSRIAGNVSIPKEDALHENYSFDVSHRTTREHKKGDQVVICEYTGWLGLRKYDVEWKK